MILIINTANKEYVEVILASDRDDFKVKKIEGERKQAEELLPLIEGIVSEANKKMIDIKGITVISGPGGFTALRIGVVTANTLGYGLKVPVVGIKLDEFNGNEDLVEKSIDKLKSAKVGDIVMPEYGSEPNIG